MGFTWFYHGFWIFFDIFGPPNSSGFHFTTCSFDQFAENLREMGWNQCSQSRFLWPKSSRNLATADTADTGALGFVWRIMIFHDFPWFSMIFPNQIAILQECEQFADTPIWHIWDSPGYTQRHLATEICVVFAHPGSAWTRNHACGQEGKYHMKFPCYIYVYISYMECPQLHRMCLMILIIPMVHQKQATAHRTHTDKSRAMKLMMWSPKPMRKLMNQLYIPSGNLT